METSIIVEVHCHQPLWAINHRDNRYRDSKYRIYVDDDLITERSWIWDNSTYLQEHIWVELNPTASHTLRLEPITYIPEQADFKLAALKVEEQTVTVTDSTKNQVTFKFA
jgi:hypothetical protein